MARRESKDESANQAEPPLNWKLKLATSPFRQNDTIIINWAPYWACSIQCVSSTVRTVYSNQLSSARWPNVY